MLLSSRLVEAVTPAFTRDAVCSGRIPLSVVSEYMQITQIASKQMSQVLHAAKFRMSARQNILTRYSSTASPWRAEDTSPVVLTGEPLECFAYFLIVLVARQIGPTAPPLPPPAQRSSLSRTFLQNESKNHQYSDVTG